MLPALRYLDVCLVLATAPFVLAAGLPLTGYLIGAAVWLLTRAAAAELHARALRLGDPKLRAGLLVGTMMGRVLLVVAAVLVARYAGSRDDGIMAAALVLGAFTVYLGLSVVFRDEMLLGRPSAS